MGKLLSLWLIIWTPYEHVCLIIIIQLIHHLCLCKVRARHQEWSWWRWWWRSSKISSLSIQGLQAKWQSLLSVRKRLTNTCWRIVQVWMRKFSIYWIGGSLILVSIVYYLGWHGMYWLHQFLQWLLSWHLV